MFTLLRQPFPGQRGQAPQLLGLVDQPLRGHRTDRVDHLIVQEPFDFLGLVGDRVGVRLPGVRLGLLVQGGLGGPTDRPDRVEAQDDGQRQGDLGDPPR